MQVLVIFISARLKFYVNDDNSIFFFKFFKINFQETTKEDITLVFCEKPSETLIFVVFVDAKSQSGVSFPLCPFHVFEFEFKVGL